MVDIKKAAMAAVGVTGISYLLGLGYSKFFADGIATITLSAVDVNVAGQVKAGVDTTLAGKLVAYLGGIIHQDGIIGALIVLFVASFLVVLGGSWISERINVGKTDTSRFAIGMAVAAGIIGIGVGSMSVSIGAIGTGLAMLVYYGIIAVVYMWLSRVDGIKNFMPTP